MTSKRLNRHKLKFIANNLYDARTNRLSVKIFGHAKLRVQIFISHNHLLISSSQSRLSYKQSWVTLTRSERKKWSARPNLSLIKNGQFHHYQWQINYLIRLKWLNCQILEIFSAWLHLTNFYVEFKLVLSSSWLFREC